MVNSSNNSPHQQKSEGESSTSGSQQQSDFIKQHCQIKSEHCYKWYKYKDWLWCNISSCQQVCLALELWVRAAELSQQLWSLRETWWVGMWLPVLPVMFRSWSYEWNKERNCEVALSVPELFLLERFWPRTVCVVYYRPKGRFMEYDFLSVKEVMREWPYHREQEPALFLRLQLDTFISSAHPVDGANWMGRWLWQPCLAALGAKPQGLGEDAELSQMGPSSHPRTWGREGLGQHPLGMRALAPQRKEHFTLVHTGALHSFQGTLVPLHTEQDIAHPVAMKWAPVNSESCD